jgi:site-specific DNA-methyltransferase (adenine-specific)
MKQIVINADNIKALKEYPDNYFDAVVTDPPYGLGKEPNAAELMKDWVEKGYHEITGTGFMGKEWDAFVPQPIFWKEVFRVLKHGGHLVSFFGTRTYDWGVMAMRFAGFEVRDCIQWIYGSGFPKSHNISKAIDKLHGAEREIIGSMQLQGTAKTLKGNNYNGDKNVEKTENYNITAPSTEQAKQWQGWGSALKPANEPIVLARKPLEKGLSIAENVMKWGTGGINIDGCRVATSDDILNHGSKVDSKTFSQVKSCDSFQSEGQKLGRFPANLILSHHPECECKGLKKVKSHNPDNKTDNVGFNPKGDILYGIGKGITNNIGYSDENGEETIEDWDCHEDCPIRIMDEQSGESKSQRSERGNKINCNVYGKYKEQENTLRGHNDLGGASRFFYCAKASKSERNKGLEGFEEKESGSMSGTKDKSLLTGTGNERNNMNINFHPTVKPVKLMQYLVRLITPPNGKVLDPFCGSGTTGIACKLEGFEFVGIEQDPEYTKIAQARIENCIKDKQLNLF